MFLHNPNGHWYGKCNHLPTLHPCCRLPQVSQCKRLVFCTSSRSAFLCHHHELTPAQAIVFTRREETKQPALQCHKNKSGLICPELGSSQGTLTDLMTLLVQPPWHHASGKMNPKQKGQSEVPSASSPAASLHSQAI